MKTTERREALLQKEKLILNLRTQLQEAKMKAVYAQESLILDQVENEGKVLREIEREVEKKADEIQYHKRADYCRVCCAEISRAAPDDRVLLLSKEVPIEKRRDIAKAHIINSLRHQNALLSKASKLREDYAQEIQLSAEQLYESIKFDDTLSLGSKGVGRLLSATSQMRANLASIRKQATATATDVSSILENAEKQIIQKLEILHSKTTALAEIPDILAYFDTLF
eukprot:TRINITY_DN9786_c0_g1_i1.p1 TRINITY_DN9786_c0_g1~~TRINITY_DN9786_c0_g1_i1.p1  ORF type:complete len:253 (+),score=62.34 TRINITY_DN9786_c0_g1_i1:84-761(+)